MMRARCTSMVRGLMPRLAAGLLVGGAGGDLRQHLALAWRQQCLAGKIVRRRAIAAALRLA